MRDELLALLEEKPYTILELAGVLGVNQFALRQPRRCGRWCVDCVRMVLKTILVEAVAVAVAWGFAWLMN